MEHRADGRSVPNPLGVFATFDGLPRGVLVGLHSARRCDYRVIYGVGENPRTVEIVHTDRRSDIYRR